MAERSEFELVVSEGKKSLASRLLAAVFFACMLVMVLNTVSSFYFHEVNEDLCREAARSLQPILFCFAGGVAFSMTKAVLIDTDTDKLLSRFEVGPFSRTIASPVPQLEYVAVFKNQKEEYEVNLWYKGNKHYKMYVFESTALAMEFAKVIAIKLNIDMLDTTEKGNSKWIEIPKV